MIGIRDFTAEEIGEINSYVVNQIPQSILPTLFILTEDPMKKSKAFNVIYRILTAAKDFIENKETQEKLGKFLEYYAQDYQILYGLYLDSETNSYKSHKIELKIMNFYKNHESNLRINQMINVFLVFAEKQELLETEKVTGLNMDLEEGKELHSKLMTGFR